MTRLPAPHPRSFRLKSVIRRKGDLNLIHSYYLIYHSSEVVELIAHMSARFSVVFNFKCELTLFGSIVLSWLVLSPG